ncbi:MAG: hypothetical protein IJV13_08785 [Prevotella sp.]|nr:hypothetical protein [Prevotella sp.]
MAENEQIQAITAEEYVKSISPNANISESTIKGILIDAAIEEGTPATELTEKQKDLSLAYLLIRIAFNPIMSQKVTDKDGDWEHSEGSEQWSRSQLQQFLILARDLLAKWGITDARIESLAPKWGMKGTGFHKIRRYK